MRTLSLTCYQIPAVWCFHSQGDLCILSISGVYHVSSNLPLYNTLLCIECVLLCYWGICCVATGNFLYQTMLHKIYKSKHFCESCRVVKLLRNLCIHWLPDTVWSKAIPFDHDTMIHLSCMQSVQSYPWNDDTFNRDTLEASGIASFHCIYFSWNGRMYLWLRVIGIICLVI